MKNQFIQLLLALMMLILAAQMSIEIPLNHGTIPITGQTLAVLLVGYFLGHFWGMTAVFLYVLLGVLGLPIFAEGKAGWAVLMGGSGGYLIGFIAGAYTVGALKKLDWPKTFLFALINQSVGTLVILAFGVAWLTYLFGLAKALEYGFYPFWLGAVVKVILGGIMIWAVQNFTFFSKFTL